MDNPTVFTCEAILMWFRLFLMGKDAQMILKTGFKIGYRDVLGEVEEEIVLGEGNHYLLARNGRGKTTLLRSLSSVLQPKAGSYTYEGRLKFVPEDIFFNAHLDARAIMKSLIPRKRLKDAYYMAEKIELDVKKAYRNLSTGNQRKISLLVAEYSSAGDEGQILLLDEPFTGLDSHVREIFLQHWEENQQGVCRLVSCHPDFDSMDLSSSVIISGGRIFHQKSERGQTWKELRTQLA